MTPRSMSAWAAIALTSLVPLNASAFQFVSASMNSWSGCDCSAGGLNYTDDQISMFNHSMGGSGHDNVHWYHNQNVWATDAAEDELGGHDNFQTDPYDLYIYSGHGDAPNAGAIQFYSAQHCRNDGLSDCKMDSRRTVLGERVGGFSSPNAGWIRWLILVTCRSVHTRPNEMWGPTLSTGGDMVIGYRGLSADSENTDEVPEDFANQAFRTTDKLKAAWFWAIEDYWINDTGSLIASGTSSADAASRRDNLRSTSARRGAVTHSVFSWAWHEG